MKLTLNGILAVAVTLLVAACDAGSDGSEKPGSSNGSPSMAPSPSGLQTSMPATASPTFTCDGPLGSLTIDLPCEVGLSLAAQSTISAVECTVHTPTASGKVSFLVPLDQISRSLNSPTDLSGFPAAPLYSIAGLRLEGLSGVAVFSAVDVGGRAFQGRFADASLTFSPGGSVCRIHDGLLRGVPGSFL
jgi:hypothetical protein